MIGDECVGGRVRLVKTVAGELVDQFEDLDGLLLFYVVFLGTFDEARLLLRHLILVFLTHCATQEVGFAERVAGQHLRDLHHLFLIDDDAVSLLQDRFEQGVRILDRLLAVLAVDVGRDVVHRAGAIERHHGDDVLEPVGLKPLQALAHARRFKLEHTDRIGLGQQVVGWLVVEFQPREIDLDAPSLADEIDGSFQHGQCFQTEEVEFDETRLLDQFPIVLRDRKTRLRIAIQRYQFVERAVTDHHAGGVRRGVAVQALELDRGLDQTGDERIAVARFL